MSRKPFVNPYVQKIRAEMDEERWAEECARTGRPTYWMPGDPLNAAQCYMANLKPACPVWIVASLADRPPPPDVTATYPSISSQAPVQPSPLAVIQEEISQLRAHLDELLIRFDLQSKEIARLKKQATKLDVGVPTPEWKKTKAARGLTLYRRKFDAGALALDACIYRPIADSSDIPWRVYVRTTGKLAASGTSNSVLEATLQAEKAAAAWTREQHPDLR